MKVKAGPVSTKVVLAHEDRPLVLPAEGVIEAHEAGELVAMYKLSTGRLNSEGRRGRAVITSLVADRDGDVVVPSGAITENFEKNPVVLLNHEHRGLPVGRANKLERRKKSIVAEWEFARADENPLAEYTYKLWAGGFLNATSIGFLPLEIVTAEEAGGKIEGVKFSGLAFPKWELLEFSIVTVPANQEALRTDAAKKYWPAVVKSLNGGVWSVDEFTKELTTDTVDTAIDNTTAPNTVPWTIPKEIPSGTGGTGGTVLEKGVITYGAAHPNGTPKAPEDTPWDGPAEVKKADVEDLKVMCAWYDSENPDVKGSYKIPHHKAKGHAVVWNGVKAGMGAVLGARGGVNIPDGDRKGVYNHLVKHYKEFDKEPPEFRDYSPEDLVQMFPELYRDVETLDDVRIAWTAGAIEAEEAFALIKQIVRRVEEELGAAKEEAARWKQECAKLAARAILRG